MAGEGGTLLIGPFTMREVAAGPNNAAVIIHLPSRNGDHRHPVAALAPLSGMN